jgi:hypothetical protein
MSTLNIALQNCATETVWLSDPTERRLKRASGCKDMRDLAEYNLTVRDEWPGSVAPIQALIRSRFERLSIKVKPIATIDPITDGEIKAAEEKLQQMFPGINVRKLTKVGLSKVKPYTDWVRTT